MWMLEFQWGQGHTNTVIWRSHLPSRCCSRSMAHSIGLLPFSRDLDVTRSNFWFVFAFQSCQRREGQGGPRSGQQTFLRLRPPPGHDQSNVRELEVASGHVLEALWSSKRHLQMVESMDPEPTDKEGLLWLGLWLIHVPQSEKFQEGVASRGVIYEL